MRRVKFKVVLVDYSSGRRFSALAEGSYTLDYPKGAIVRAREETLGVAVFKTRKQAEDFRVSNISQEIIRVCSIGRGRTVRLVCMDARKFDLDTFFRVNRVSLDVAMISVPPGTMFYPAVEVLD